MFKFKQKRKFTFDMIRVQFPLWLCYSMTANKSQSQSFLNALFDTIDETLSHEQSQLKEKICSKVTSINLISGEITKNKSQHYYIAYNQKWRLNLKYMTYLMNRQIYN